MLSVARQHHGLRRLHAGGNGQLADDVAQALLGLAAGRPGFAGAGLARQRFAAAVQRRGFQPPAAQHKQQRHGRVDAEKIGRIAGRPAPAAPAASQRQVSASARIDGQHQRHHRQAKQQQQPPRSGAVAALAVAACLSKNRMPTAGGRPRAAHSSGVGHHIWMRTAWRSAALSVACSIAEGAKPNSRATSSAGNWPCALL